MPPGVDFVRAAVADPRGGVVRIATDVDPSVVVAVDDDTLRVVDVVVLPRPARHVRAGASSPDGRYSYWVTHDIPSVIVRLTHDTPRGAAAVSSAFELDPTRGEARATSVGADRTSADSSAPPAARSAPDERSRPPRLQKAPAWARGARARGARARGARQPPR